MSGLSKILEKLPSLIRRDEGGEFVLTSLLIIFAKLMGLLLGFIITMIIARWYGPSTMGLYALIGSSGFLFATIATLGLGTLIVKRLNNRGASYKSLIEVYHLSIRVSVLVALILFPAFFLAIFYGNDLGSTVSWVGLAAVSAAIFFGRTLHLLAIGAARTLETPATYAVLFFLPSLIALVAIVLAGRQGLVNSVFPLAAMGGAIIFVSIVIIWKNFLTMRREQSKELGGYPSVPREGVRNLIKEALPFLAVSGFAVMAAEGSLIVAGFILPPEQLGVYAVGHKISLLTATGYTSVGLVVQSQLASLISAGRRAEIKTHCQRSLTLAFGITLPVAFFLIIFSSKIVTLAFGAEYVRAIPALRILLFGQIIASLSAVGAPFLAMSGGQATLAKIVGLSAVVGALTTLVSTPFLGVVGPSIGLASSQLITTWFCIASIHRREGYWILPIPHLNRPNFRPWK